jgi:hypothetical protein
VGDLFSPFNSSMVAHDKKASYCLMTLLPFPLLLKIFVVCTPTPLVLFDLEKLKTVTLVQLGRNVSS